MKGEAGCFGCSLNIYLVIPSKTERVHAKKYDESFLPEIFEVRKIHQVFLADTGKTCTQK
jgi:hypothetical protein